MGSKIRHFIFSQKKTAFRRLLLTILIDLDEFRFELRPTKAKVWADEGANEWIITQMILS